MKPKVAVNARSRTPKGKIVKKEPPSEELNNVPGAYNVSLSARPSVEIVNCISFQKFRYSGENRPGKKYQEKEFMTLKLSNLQDRVVRVVIICTDADNRELIHPNGLVGKDCHDGIYDKEYAVTKQFYLIKIPYLRTERMKTKKNEHKNILGVLSARASHLPSPYRERCLSQCTDKYTSSREKFDTTKVCLGVIVTVESHQGVLNGSLHAISHVVRNASEKTSLSILKLSNDSVPAFTGAYIDIFTTEDGPAIEPDKYLVYVTYESDLQGVDSWQSERYSPTKSNLLYKRVITYEVPPFQPNLNLDSPIEVTLHLECPQSNQYCKTNFKYIPQRDIMMFDEQCYLPGQKRSNVDNDIKPSPKKLRSEMYDNDGSTESIKANLKTKIKARNETQDSILTMCIDGQSDAPGEEETAHYVSEQKQHNMYADDCRSIIHRQDPQTGESSYLLNMDACKNNSSTEAAATFVGDSQFVIQFQEKMPANHLQGRKSVNSSGSIIKTSPQDFKVVATGYSDTVPPNTVLVYTTNGIMPDRGDDGSLEQVFIQAVSNDNQMVITPNFRHAEKHVGIYTSDGVLAKSIHKGSSGHIIRGDTIAENRSSNYTNELIESDGQLAGSPADSDYSADNRHTAARMTHNAITSNAMLSMASSFADRYNPIPTSFSSSIPPIRRMLISNKAISSSSPWEVDNEDDSASDYNIVVNTFGTSNKRAAALKNKSIEEDHFRQRNEFYTPTSAQSSIPTYRLPTVHIPEKQLQHMGVNEYNKENVSIDHISLVASEEASASASDDPGASNSAGLSSMDVAEAIVNNLPTMKIFEIAEHFEDSLSANAEAEDDSQNS